MASLLGKFLLADDWDEMRMIALQLGDMSQRDNEMIRSIISSNWENEPQMVSNLLHFAFLMPEDIRLNSILRGLQEEKQPYYILASAAGLCRLQIADEKLPEVKERLKNVATRHQGIIAIRAFTTLSEYLTHPKDTQFVLRFMHKLNSPLRYSACDWLLRHIEDKEELLKTLTDKSVPEEVRKEAMDCINDKDSGESLIESGAPIFIPSLADFEAMMSKEQSLAEMFLDYDTDKDGLVGAEEVRDFFEDIGKEVTLEQVKKDIASVDSDKDGKIDKDEWIELMFPKFNVPD